MCAIIKLYPNEIMHFKERVERCGVHRIPQLAPASDTSFFVFFNFLLSFHFLSFASFFLFLGWVYLRLHCSFSFFFKFFCVFALFLAEEACRSVFAEEESHASRFIAGEPNASRCSNAASWASLSVTSDQDSCSSVSVT